MRLTDIDEIRSRLNTDRHWCVYLLGDLAPPLFPKCVWYGSPKRPALALLFCGYETRVLCTLGPAVDVAPLLDEIGATHDMYLHIRPQILPLIQQRFRVTWHKRMRRMVLDAGRYRSEPSNDVKRLGPERLADVQELYEDGRPTNEMPDFFFPSMLSDGVFFGAYEGTRLLATAGTHLVAQGEGVAAVGNIFTRRDRRGRGLAHRCTRAVVDALRDMRIPSIALNVYEKNAAAIRVYEDLGFVHYCDFVEGFAAPPSGEGP